MITRQQLYCCVGSYESYPVLTKIKWDWSTTTGNSGIFIGGNIFVGTDEFILKYIRRYPKPTNICYIRRFGLCTDEYIGHPG
jgi:hypothetical protein